MKNFSERLQTLMDEQFITQADLARMLRTSQSTVLRWLTGSAPRARMLADLAHALNTTPVWLAEGRGTRKLEPEDAPAQRIAETDMQQLYDLRSYLNIQPMPCLIQMARLLGTGNFDKKTLFIEVTAAMERKTPQPAKV
jgi:transcriptional regulator with XRE-family HTH domain